MHFVLWGSLQRWPIAHATVREIVSMHFVLWGSLQLPYAAPGTNLVSVSMHFVLWGSLQRGGAGGQRFRLCFNALRALGFSSTRRQHPRPADRSGFNALRALGFSSTVGYALGDTLHGFQCTSCFGVLFNLPAFCGKVMRPSFNALRALGFSSTTCQRETMLRIKVSMHFVLWGSLQQLGFTPVFLGSCFNALRALGFSSTWIGLTHQFPELFQCTSCFGVLFNKPFALLRKVVKVSMHFVLWGSLQRYPY